MNMVGGTKMREHILKFERGPSKKKYTAYIKNNKTHKIRKIHFGARDYQQYRDSTPLHLYSYKDHKDKKRMGRYYSRHSGTKKRGEGIEKEKRKSRGIYNAKILSHVYLW